MSNMEKNGVRRARHSFSEEFRAGAVRLALDQGKSAGGVARDLDLTESALRARVIRARADRIATLCRTSRVSRCRGWTS